MNKLLLPGVACLLLSACVSLPGSESAAASRYMLTGVEGDCRAGNRPLVVAVSQVSAGLDTDRVARREGRSGRYSYLQGVRWVGQAGKMLEQRLANDLECSGYAVITSHHRSLGHDQLICELRALNLLETFGNDRAEVALSCVFYPADDGQELALRSHHTGELRQWSADEAVAAMSEAYRKVFAELLAGLP